VTVEACLLLTPPVAQHNGEIKIMDAQTGGFKKLTSPLKTSDRTERRGYPITHLRITNDGEQSGKYLTQRNALTAYRQKTLKKLSKTEL
jgi:hypothetical protein